MRERTCYVIAQHPVNETMRRSPANHCEISMLANIRRVVPSCQRDPFRSRRGMRRRFGVLAAVRSRRTSDIFRSLRGYGLRRRGARTEGCFATSGCHGEDWRDFCSRYLRMSGSQADKIIHLWEEFGEGFFKVAQLTRISPQTYRAIAPAVREEALHLNGEVIELRVENSRQLAEAVARHRRAKKPACRTEAYIRPGGNRGPVRGDRRRVARNCFHGPHRRRLGALQGRRFPRVERAELPAVGLRHRVAGERPAKRRATRLQEPAGDDRHWRYLKPVQRRRCPGCGYGPVGRHGPPSGRGVSQDPFPRAGCLRTQSRGSANRGLLR